MLEVAIMLVFCRRIGLVLLAVVLLLLALPMQIWANPRNGELLARVVTKTCSSCNGSGQSWSKEYAVDYGGGTRYEYCPVCNSRERRHTHKSCFNCGGTGHVESVDTSEPCGGGYGSAPSVGSYGSVPGAGNYMVPGMPADTQQMVVQCPNCGSSATCLYSVSCNIFSFYCGRCRAQHTGPIFGR